MSFHTRHIIAALVILSAGFILHACKDSSNPITKPGDVVFPAKNISYDRQVQPLFNIACATTDCHDRQTRQSNLDLASFAGLKGSPYGIVIPNDTANSRLLWCIEGRPGSPPMPPPPLPSLNINQLQGLTRWIYEGANDSIP